MWHKKIKALFQNQSKKLIKLQDQHSFCPLSESSQSLGMGGVGQLNFFLKFVGETRWEEERKYKILRRDEIFSFSLSHFSYHCNWHCFCRLGQKRKSLVHCFPVKVGLLLNTWHNSSLHITTGLEIKTFNMVFANLELSVNEKFVVYEWDNGQDFGKFGTAIERV